MNLLQIITLVFIIIELTNILSLYFWKDTSKANGTGCFKALQEAKQNPHIYDMVRYLINWVAGTKLIFLVLLLVILILGDAVVQMWSTIVLILAICSFYIGLFPIIKKMDAEGQIVPKGYSKILLIMITSLVIGFSAGLITVYAV
jgi:hypothetical protein